MRTIDFRPEIQPISQSTNRLNSQTNNGPNDQQTNQPTTDRARHRRSDWPTERPTERPINQSTRQPGRDVVEALSNRLLTADTQIRSQDSPSEISAALSGSATGLSPSTSVFPCQLSAHQCPIIIHASIVVATLETLAAVVPTDSESCRPKATASMACSFPLLIWYFRELMASWI
jgi:hypothetical protein